MKVSYLKKKKQIKANLMNNFQVEIIAAIRKESTGMATSCMILTRILSPAT
jgi:hypothetical protein